jgi:hypothetical protein
MVADTGLGWDYPIRVNLTDQNGSPLSGAPNLGGTTNVYGPGSATTIVAVDTASDFGGGDYGIDVPGTDLLVPGYYTWVIPTITVAGTTFTNLTGGFSVGHIPPEYRTLRAVVVAVCEALGVGIAGTSTGAGSTSTLVDTRWLDAGIATNEFVGDELLLLEPAAATDRNPVRVTAFAPGTGTFTFAPAVTGMASGRDYLLIRPGKRGLRYAQIIEAIVAAVADLATRQPVTDSVTLRTARGTREYNLPSSWLRVNRIEIAQQPTAWDPYWEELAPVYYVLWEDRQKVYIRHDFGGEYLLRLTGTVGVPEPRSLGALVKVPWTLARDLAVGYLSVPIEQRAGLAYRRATAAAGRRSA